VSNAEAILSMPGPRRQHSDIWAWAWDRHGLFSVRSAYRKLLEQQNCYDHLASNADGKEASWKALWRLQVMPKIHIFWWREKLATELRGDEKMSHEGD
jgi:hypothetical protein